MKRILIISWLLIICQMLMSQVSENKSGVKQFNISRTGAEQKKFTDQSRAVTDETPPVISLESPVFEKDSLVKADSRTLEVKGKVVDQGGIFAVMINGIEAKVSSDGQFLAQVPLAFGRNTIRVVATDVSMNNSVVQFYSERPTQALADLPEEKIAEAKPANKYDINIIQPSASNQLSANDKFNVQACINSTAPIKKIMIYRDASFVNGYVGNKIMRKGDCSFQLDEPVPLKLGLNEITIELYAGYDTVKKSVFVEYSLYAAKNYALIIGNQNYDDPAISELSQPLKDASDLYNVLTQYYNFDSANVTLLKNPNKADIIGTLHKFRSVVKPEDNLLIFYAGHGYFDEGMGVGYWLPRDASKANPVNWIPNTDLTNYLGAIKSKHTLLIADACFSGGIFKTRSAFSATYAIEMLYQMNSRKAITSGTLSEVPDKSVFFQYLIKNLKENQNEYLSAEELFSRMRMAVINNSENVPQFGTIQNVGDEGGDYIFIKKKY